MEFDPTDLKRVIEAAERPSQWAPRRAAQMAGIRLCYVAEAAAREIWNSRWPALGERIAAAISGGHEEHIPALLDAFDDEMVGAAKFATTAIALPAEVVRQAASDMMARLYRGTEPDALAATLRYGEKIIEVGWWAIKTDQRTITRHELRAALRPVTHRNDSSWASQFATEAQIRDAEARNQPSGLENTR